MTLAILHKGLFLPMTMDHDVRLAAYYFPNFHVDPTSEAWHGQGWTEWELVRRAEARFPGHFQPRVPQWGYEDEADPDVMSRKIDIAVEHGIDVFLFDWYWYDGKPFLHRPLEQAFMTAQANEDLDFAVMWANHDWMNIHPWKRSTDVRVLAEGAVNADQFAEATDYIIERYFNHPRYFRLADRPYLSIYDLATLVTGLGGVTAAANALQQLRVRAARAGFPDIHLNVIGWDHAVLPNHDAQIDFDAAVAVMGFDSVTSYVWVHHHRLPTLATPYVDLLNAAEQGWHGFASRYPVPYYPNVTVGWDSSPRTVQSDGYDPALGYPHSNVVVGNTPELFGEALDRARRFLAGTSYQPKLLTINSWNEWTEGSYLEPDTVYGMGYLEQIQKIFGARP